MRVIAKRHLVDCWTKHPDTEQALKSWHDEVSKAKWQTPQDINRQYASASFLANNRVVFNIKGNPHRLIVAIAYRFGAVYIKFIGTHEQYDQVGAANVEMD
jgi:mRNA interferase HigB